MYVYVCDSGCEALIYISRLLYFC